MTTQPSGEPLFFAQPNGEEIFGVLHPADGDTALVVINPFGYEAVCSYRALRHLAEATAAAGYPTLRFDYPGTFDSGGVAGDEDQVPRWLDAIRAAARAVLSSTSATRVVLLGVRLGGLLATKVLAEPGDLPIGGAVLFAPVVKGRAYTRELRAFRLLLGDPHPLAPERAEGSEEAAGFAMSKATVASLGKLDATTLRPFGRVLVLTHTGAESGLADAWSHAELSAEHGPATGYGDMMLDPHRAHVPHDTIRDIIAWLKRSFPGDTVRDLGPPPPAPPPPARRRAAIVHPPTDLVAPALAGARLREEAIRFGPRERLFGIVARPEEGTTSKSAAVLLLNAGAVAHTGPNRMSVLLARSWAARGYTVLRMDVGGIGESGPAPGAPENDTYAKAALDDATAGVALLRAGARGSPAPRQVVVSGLCSGAYLSFHLALRGRVDGALLVNPQTFYWKDGMSLDIAPSKTFNQAKHYKSAFTRLATWQKLARGQIDLRLFARTVSARARHVAEARAERAMARWFPPERENLRKDLSEILERNVDLAMFFSAGDPGLDFLDLYLGDQEIARMKKKSRLHLEILDGPDHTFTPIWTQPILYERLTRTLEERFPGLAERVR